MKEEVRSQANLEKAVIKDAIIGVLVGLVLTAGVDVALEHIKAMEIGVVFGKWIIEHAPLLLNGDYSVEEPSKVLLQFKHLYVFNAMLGMSLNVVAGDIKRAVDWDKVKQVLTRMLNY